MNENRLPYPFKTWVWEVCFFMAVTNDMKKQLVINTLSFVFYDTTKSQVCDIIIKMEDYIDAKNINSRR